MSDASRMVSIRLPISLLEWIESAPLPCNDTRSSRILFMLQLMRDVFTAIPTREREMLKRSAIESSMEESISQHLRRAILKDEFDALKEDHERIEQAIGRLEILVDEWHLAAEFYAPGEDDMVPKEVVELLLAMQMKRRSDSSEHEKRGEETTAKPFKEWRPRGHKPRPLREGSFDS
jgi:hypothetical protein